MGTRITSIDELIGKATPVELHGLPKGVVRLRSDWIVPLKECFDFFCDFDASVSLNEGDDFPLRIVIALDIQRGRPQARMTGELLDVSEAPADLAVFSGGTSDESPATAVA